MADRIARPGLAERLLTVWATGIGPMPPTRLVKAWTGDPKPFICPKTAGQIR